MKKVLSFFNEWIGLPAIYSVVAILIIWLLGVFVTFDLNWAYSFLEKISHGKPFEASVRLFIVLFYFLFASAKYLEKNEKR